MSGSHDLEGRLAAHYTREAPRRAPDRVLASALETIETTPQRRAWWPARRMPEMNAFVKIALGAAAVVVASVVGLSVLGGGTTPGIGGPPDPSLSPSPSPSPSPPPLPVEGDVEAGAYVTNQGPWRIQLTLPAGFSSIEALAAFHGTTDPPDGHGISFWRAESVYGNPCGSLITRKAIGPSVDDFVNALMAREGGAIVEAGSIELSGFVGRKVTIQVPKDVAFLDGEFPECSGGELRSWSNSNDEVRHHQGPGQIDELWVIGNEEGTERLIIDLSSFPGTSEDHLAELQAIVDSLVITLE